jgi:hypothetical protein
MVRPDQRLSLGGLSCGLLLALHGHDDPLAFAAGMAALVMTAFHFALVRIQASSAIARVDVKKGAAQRRATP